MKAYFIYSIQQLYEVHYYPHLIAEESQVMIIKLGTYYVPGPKLKASPRDGFITTALLPGRIHLYLERRN